MRHLLDLRRPADAITLINMAMSGQTTTQALAALPGLCLQRPDWVLCMLGANDVQRFRPAEEPADGPTLVSLAETERNLRALRELTAQRTTARWVWLTPPTWTRPGSRPTRRSSTWGSRGPIATSTPSATS
ncbi:SGNH/GDSL hydrolase family protein [Microbispora sp. CA-102843]|uniref:SGNH/GDSL hydrolase family protein n=1 Tax=Microbispora sp. CA-102843 TaxID=3239952 RepID=UPI003D8A72D2